jgi:hypothetical protein
MAIKPIAVLVLKGQTPEALTLNECRSVATNWRDKDFLFGVGLFVRSLVG